MDYIEKAKYEIIMALKNKEDIEIIDFLKQYYKDMVDILKNEFKNIMITKSSSSKETRNRFLLKIYKEDENISFLFSSEKKLLDFFERYQNISDIETCSLITVSQINLLDPENFKQQITEIEITKWRQQMKL